MQIRAFQKRPWSNPVNTDRQVNLFEAEAPGKCPGSYFLKPTGKRDSFQFRTSEECLLTNSLDCPLNHNFLEVTASQKSFRFNLAHIFGNRHIFQRLQLFERACTDHAQ